MQLYFSAHWTWTCSLLLHTRVLWTLLCAGSLSLSAYRVLVNLLTETDAIRPITSTTSSLSLSFSLVSGLYWVAITVYDLQMQHSSCAVLRLFAPFQWLFAERGKSYASECTQYTPHTHTHIQRHRHSHACLMSVCGRWPLSSSVLKVAIVESRMRTCPSTTFSLMSIAFYVQDMTALHKMFASCARVLFDIIKMGQTNWGATPYL